MASNSQNAPATDSAAELHKIIGPDSTASFEDNPTFVDSNPAAGGSSENLGAASADANEDELDEDGNVVEDDDEEDDDVVVDDGGNESVDDEDEEYEDDDEDDEDDDEDDEDDDEGDVEDGEVDEEDDAAEAGTAPALRADGLLGYEDEADDEKAHRSVNQGNAERAKDDAAINDGEDDYVPDHDREGVETDDEATGSVTSVPALDRLPMDSEAVLDEDEARRDEDEAARIERGLRALSAIPQSHGAAELCG